MPLHYRGITIFLAKNSPLIMLMPIALVRVSRTIARNFS